MQAQRLHHHNHHTTNEICFLVHLPTYAQVAIYHTCRYYFYINMTIWRVRFIKLDLGRSLLRDRTGGQRSYRTSVGQWMESLYSCRHLMIQSLCHPVHHSPIYASEPCLGQLTGKLGGQFHDVPRWWRRDYLYCRELREAQRSALISPTSYRTTSQTCASSRSHDSRLEQRYMDFIHVGHAHLLDIIRQIISKVPDREAAAKSFASSSFRMLYL